MAQIPSTPHSSPSLSPDDAPPSVSPKVEKICSSSIDELAGEGTCFGRTIKVLSPDDATSTYLRASTERFTTGIRVSYGNLIGDWASSQSQQTATTKALTDYAIQFRSLS
jgi:hypothetical protein